MSFFSQKMGCVRNFCKKLLKRVSLFLLNLVHNWQFSTKLNFHFWTPVKVTFARKCPPFAWPEELSDPKNFCINSLQVWQRWCEMSSKKASLTKVLGFSQLPSEEVSGFCSSLLWGRALVILRGFHGKSWSHTCFLDSIHPQTGWRPFHRLFHHSKWMSCVSSARAVLSVTQLWKQAAASLQVLLA